MDMGQVGVKSPVAFFAQDPAATGNDGAYKVAWTGNVIMTLVQLVTRCGAGFSLLAAFTGLPAGVAFVAAFTATVQALTLAPGNTIAIAIALGTVFSIGVHDVRTIPHPNITPVCYDFWKKKTPTGPFEISAAKQRRAKSLEKIHAQGQKAFRAFWDDHGRGEQLPDAFVVCSKFWFVWWCAQLVSENEYAIKVGADGTVSPGHLTTGSTWATAEDGMLPKWSAMHATTAKLHIQSEDGSTIKTITLVFCLHLSFLRRCVLQIFGVAVSSAHPTDICVFAGQSRGQQTSKWRTCALPASSSSRWR
jgi:hypothetical protein